MAATLRERLVQIAIEWQERFGVAPAITSTISELDAATVLIGMTEDDYCSDCKSEDRGAVKEGFDFISDGCRYQVKANRPSGKRGSKVNLVAKARNYDWDKLIWILYDRNYIIQEAWEWTREEYRQNFDSIERVRPRDMQKGRKLRWKNKPQPRT